MTKKQITILTVAGLTIVLGIAIFGLWSRFSTPTIKNINVKDNETNRDIYENIVIIFNQSIGENQTEYIKLENNDSLAAPRYSYFFNDQTLTLKVNPELPFYPETEYKLSVTPISENGQHKGKTVVINFKTASLDDSGVLPLKLQEIGMKKTNVFEDGGLPGLSFIGELPIKRASFNILYANQVRKDDGSLSIDLNVNYLSASGAADLHKYLVSQGADFKKIKIIETTE